MVQSAQRLDCHDPGSCQYHGSWQDPGSMDPPAYNPGILGRRICQDPAGSWHFCYDFTLSWTHPWDDFDQTYIFRLVLTWATRVNKENIRVAIISNVFNGSWNPGSQKSADPWGPISGAPCIQKIHARMHVHAHTNEYKSTNDILLTCYGAHMYMHILM